MAEHLVRFGAQCSTMEDFSGIFAPQRCTTLGEAASCEPSRGKICWTVRSVGASAKNVYTLGHFTF